MNAAIYARKSTEQTGVTEENRSVTRQKQSARKFAVERGWTVVAEFEDDGISGAEFDNRPGLVTQRRVAWGGRVSNTGGGEAKVHRA